jgi:cobalamin biosynthesis protein CobC
LQEARRLFPLAPEPFIDLSTGINPLPYPIPQLETEAWTRLPEPEAVTALEAVAAKAYGISDAAMVAAAPGTQILISLLPQLFPQDSVAILGPTYGEYARAFAAAGSKVIEARHIGELRAALCIVICNPNNPDGRRHDTATLLDLVDARPKGGLVIVDEAFADLEDAALSLTSSLPQRGLVVLRSFSKAYGLGGLRLAFALAGQDIAVPLRAALGPWPVSGPAIDIGRRTLGDRPWLAAAKRRLASDVARLDGILRDAGLALVGGTHLFRLAATPQARETARRLGEAGILVRSFDYRPDWLRFGIPGSQDAWQRLASALT